MGSLQTTGTWHFVPRDPIIAKLKRARRCEACFRCDHIFRPDEAVFRERCVVGPGLFGHDFRKVLPVCASCRLRTCFEAEPCEHCGRLVYYTEWHLGRRRVFCCEKCPKAHHSARLAARARQRRAEARGPSRPCAACGQNFEPSRAEARFCSGTCRQRAYRKDRASRMSFPHSRQWVNGSRNAITHHSHARNPDAVSAGASPATFHLEDTPGREPIERGVGLITDPARRRRRFSPQMPTTQ